MANEQPDAQYEFPVGREMMIELFRGRRNMEGSIASLFLRSHKVKRGWIVRCGQSHLVIHPEKISPPSNDMHQAGFRSIRVRCRTNKTVVRRRYACTSEQRR
jgi:hypothetical protein